MGKEWDKALPDIKIWKECLRVLKPGAFAFIMSAPRQDVLSRMMLDLETTGFLINFSSIYWSYASGFPKSINLSKAADKRAGAERKITGLKLEVERLMNQIDKNGNRKGNGTWGDEVNRSPHITAPSTDKAKLLNGAHGGFQMKPAVEIIIVVQKPLQEKSYIDQALKYADEMMNKKQFIEMYDVRNIFQDKLLECSEAVEKTFPFLIVPKASKSEKNKGCETATKKLKYGELASGDAKDPIKRKDILENGKIIKGNNHPTVKPVKLMSYLITLSTIPEDIVLDPFMGSGTTGIAAKKLNRQFIGIEMDKEYMKIANARIKATETDNRYIVNKFW